VAIGEASASVRTVCGWFRGPGLYLLREDAGRGALVPSRVRDQGLLGQWEAWGAHFPPVAVCLTTEGPAAGTLCSAWLPPAPDTSAGVLIDLSKAQQ